MKEIKAFIKPNRVENVVEALQKAGCVPIAGFSLYGQSSG